MNGAIWVDRKDKEDTRCSKERVQKHLCSGKSLIWFPEGTWNLTDSLLMLPMKWGIIECAQKCRVPIYPVVIDYSTENKQCIVSFGEPFNPENMTLQDGITALRNKMAELRWELWEQNRLISREDLNPQKERSSIYQAVVDYPPLDLEYEQSVIFQLP